MEQCERAPRNAGNTALFRRFTFLLCTCEQTMVITLDALGNIYIVCGVAIENDAIWGKKT
ncbi:hypothetical protein AZE99_15590 [Sphingorhabdus sp. M41]|nr:hypothetical protein AZE99_15590 [Sphingorhabdus sp. M41]